MISAEFISLWKLFDCAEVFPQNLQHKRDILFDLQKKCIDVVISCDLGIWFCCGNSSAHEYPFAEILGLFAGLVGDPSASSRLLREDT